MGAKKRSGKPASKKFSKPKAKLPAKRKGDAIENSNDEEVTCCSVSLALLMRDQTGRISKRKRIPSPVPPESKSKEPKDLGPVFDINRRFLISLARESRVTRRRNAD